MKRNRLKSQAVDLYSKMTDNEVAALIKSSGNDFMRSEEWFVLKAQTIAKYGCTCMKCKKKISMWTDINVDHIKPRKYYPHLANDPDNLQILCGRCNKEKGNLHSTDYRSCTNKKKIYNEIKANRATDPDRSEMLTSG